MTPEQAKTLGQIEQKIDDFVSINKEEHRLIREQIGLNREYVEARLIEKNGQAETRRLECQKIFDSKVSIGWFKWIVGGVFVCLLAIAGMMLDIDQSIERHIEAGQEAWLMDHPGEEPIDLRGD